MKKLSVLITNPLEKAHLDMIAAVDSRVEVKYALDEMCVERGIPENMIIAPYKPSQRIKTLTPKEASDALDRMLADTEVLFAWRLPMNILARAPHLKWVHTPGSGIDHVSQGSGLVQSDVIITNSVGIKNTFQAEFVILQMLMLSRYAKRMFTNQLGHRWELIVGRQIGGKTLGVIGLGRIGSEIAGLAKALGMRVLASRRSALTRQKNTNGVDELFPAKELLQMLPQCDFVVLVTPFNDETTGLIGEAELRVMKRTAYFINVSRGPIVQEKMLVRALKEGWLAGAALDVFETEPLPPDSELWDMPNVIVSPHTAGHSGEHVTQVTEVFCENLRRYLAGKEMLNVVDKKLQYWPV